MLRDQLFELDVAGKLEKGKLVHPYLQLWLGCRKYGQHIITPEGQLHIVPLLPFSGSYADQPPEVMEAFDVLEACVPDLERAHRQRDLALENPQQNIL